MKRARFTEEQRLMRQPLEQRMWTFQPKAARHPKLLDFHENKGGTLRELHGMVCHYFYGLPWAGKRLDRERF